jgi:uncharacterized protein YrrD
MNFRIGAHVEATDGRVGEITRVIVEARDRTLSHIVVRDGRFSTERLVPIEAVAEATSERVALRLAQAQFGLLQPYAHSVQYTPNAPADTYLGVAKNPITLDRAEISEDERSFRGGERVEATDGTVGKADEVIIDHDTRKLTDIVLVEGHIWHKHHVTIPVDSVDYARRGVIYLKLSKAELQPLTKPVN